VIRKIMVKQLSERVAIVTQEEGIRPDGDCSQGAGRKAIRVSHKRILLQAGSQIERREYCILASFETDFRILELQPRLRQIGSCLEGLLRELIDGPKILAAWDFDGIRCHNR